MWKLYHFSQPSANAMRHLPLPSVVSLAPQYLISSAAEPHVLTNNLTTSGESPNDKHDLCCECVYWRCMQPYTLLNISSCLCALTWHCTWPPPQSYPVCKHREPEINAEAIETIDTWALPIISSWIPFAATNHLELFADAARNLYPPCVLGCPTSPYIAPLLTPKVTTPSHDHLYILNWFTDWRWETAASRQIDANSMVHNCPHCWSDSCPMSWMLSKAFRWGGGKGEQRTWIDRARWWH